MVRIPAFHAGGPGSIPGVGTIFLHEKLIQLCASCVTVQRCFEGRNGTGFGAGYRISLRSVYGTANGVRSEQFYSSCVRVRVSMGACVRSYVCTYAPTFARTCVRVHVSMHVHIRVRNTL